MTATYRIKPLTWEYAENDTYQGWTAHTVFSELNVRRTNYEDDHQWSSWLFSYCVDEYYDEGSEEVDGPEEGKARALLWYMERLTPALEPVTRKPKP